MTQRVGLTGGIGSGKSTVADLLAARGAAVVDADVIAREVVAPGAAAYDAVVARFGREILAADATVERAALAARVFGDPDALADLNAITHPAIGAALLERLDSLERLPAAERPVVAVAVIPLLRRAHVDALALSAVVVVDCPTEVAVRRLVEARGMDEADARARVAAQASREERLALADYVVDNGSGPEHLAAEVDALWGWLKGLVAPDRLAGGAAAGDGASST
ncbi:MAG: dephospho-CoA kinase [Actinomycetota bacterium]|nr:dephospho-CoA kinase [Actinomycetota bacterium]